MSTHHEIPATRDRCSVIGYFDAALPPCADREIGRHRHPALASGGRARVAPPRPRPGAADLLHALDTLERGPGPHFVTGPSTWRAPSRRHAAGRHPRPEVPPRLGLRGDPAAPRHPAGRVHRVRDRPRRHRPARGLCRLPWGTELPLDRSSASWAPPRPRLGPGRQPGAPRLRRQHGQQGIEGRHDPLPAGVQPRRRILRGRRPRRAGRRRGLHHALETG